MKVLKAFDPMNPDHVSWFQELSKISETMNLNPIEQEKFFQKTSLEQITKNNPMGEKINPIDFPMVHFGIAMKYANAVLSHKAWIPDKKY